MSHHSTQNLTPACFWYTLMLENQTKLEAGRLTMPMHFFSILHTLKLFLEIISAGRVFLGHIWTK